MTETLPYGSWPSPITARSLVQGAVGIAELVTDGDDIWWSESRPDEGGRVAIVRRRGDDITEITPADANVRTRVHEYGGGAWWVADGDLFYVEFGDQRLRRLTPGGEPQLLTAEPPKAPPNHRLFRKGGVLVVGRAAHTCPIRGSGAHRAPPVRGHPAHRPRADEGRHGPEVPLRR